MDCESMLRRLPTLLSLLLAPVVALAQGGAPALIGADGSPLNGSSAADGRVLPIWNSDSGRVEAFMLVESSDLPGLGSASMLDRVIGTAAPRVAFGGGVVAGQAGQLSTSLYMERPASLALLCDGGLGMMGGLGSVGQQCLIGQLDRQAFDLPGYGQGVGIGSAWLGESAGIDFSFGLSWLDLESAGTRPPATLGTSAPPPAWLDGASLMGPLLGGGTLAIESRDLRLGGFLSFGDDGWLRLDGGVGRSRLEGTSAFSSGLPRSWDTGTVRLGVGMGSISGVVTGRIIELPGHAGSMSGIDLGISWRTPWQGELTVGASNVWGNSDTQGWPLGEIPAAVADEPDQRVPYVRYHQDL
jgi:hypothetical protein